MSNIKRFVMLFVTPEVDSSQTANQETEVNPDVIKVWTDWINGLIEKGAFISTEQLEMNGGKIVKPNNEVIDGPFTELKEIIGGYILVKAKDIDEAVEFAKGCPILHVGGKVDVRPLVESNY
jgi:hypothetical protein